MVREVAAELLAEAPALRRALLAWYGRTARDLPWRRTRDPYRIWLSEIMLQQTRVETVVPYYERFIAELPSLADLASSSEQQVLRLWAGLGYYTRARNLRAAARVIAGERDGAFPQSALEWRKLPGVGAYTAGAIASIACGEAVPAVDGNVKRVLARLACVEASIDDARVKQEVEGLAAKLVARGRPGDFNQALMELGARVCTPRRPRCGDCPLAGRCRARAAGRETALPRRSAKRSPTEVVAAAAWISSGGRLLLVRRAGRGLLGGLWTLPGCELAARQTAGEMLRDALRARWGLRVNVGAQVADVQHAFTHRRLRVRVYRCRWRNGAATMERTDVRWATDSEVEALPLATLDRKLLAAVRQER